MASTDLVEAPPSWIAFPEQAHDVLRRLRVAVLRLFDALPGGIRKSRDAQKLFGVNVKLSWQLFKLTGPGDLLSLASHVPSAPSMRRLLEAAAEKGVPTSVVEDVRSAYADFESLVTTHAGDRTSFTSMASSLTEGEDTEQTALQHRKLMFKGSSHYWGSQLDTYLAVAIHHPSATPGLVDHAHLRTRLGLRRLRSDADVVVDSFKLSVVSEGTDVFRRETLDPESAQRYGAPVLPQFCSRPLPPLRTSRREDGTTLTELAGDIVGQSGAVNLAFGQVSRDAPLAPSSDGKGFGFGTNVRVMTPMKLLIMDFLVHRPTHPELKRSLTVYGPSARNDMSVNPHAGVKLPFRERIMRVGSGADDAWIREVPHYVELLQFACEKLHWRLSDFDVYRTRIEYPLMHTCVAMGFEVSGA